MNTGQLIVIIFCLRLGLLVAQDCQITFLCNGSGDEPDTSNATVFADPSTTTATLAPTEAGTVVGSIAGTEFWNPFDSSTEDVCLYLLTEYLRDEALNVEKHATLLAKLPAEKCIASVQSAYSECYWCAAEATRNHEYCTTYKRKPCDVSLEERKNLTYYGTGDDTLCWGFVYRHANGQPPASILNCDLVDEAWAHCNFCAADEPYLQADTRIKQALLAWLPRIPAFLSMLGASYIFRDVIKSKWTVYHGLLFAMAIFDFCTAAAWIFTTAPIPTVDEYEDYVYGIMGNEATCKAQAFFIQLGVTSVFYNAALCSYYWLVIVRGWTERRLQKRRILLLLHGPPLLVGFALAFGGLPVYSWVQYACHLWYILPWDGKQVRVRVYLLFIAPVAASILYITIVLGLIYWKVSRQSRQSRRWRLGVGVSATLEGKVFWQCISYALAFYITWPLVALNYAFSLDEVVDRYGYTLFVALLTPLQGLANFLVYIRPRWDRYIESKKRNRIETEQTHSTSPPIGATHSTERPSAANLQTWTSSMEPSVKMAEDITDQNDDASGASISSALATGANDMTRSLDASDRSADVLALKLGGKECCTKIATHTSKTKFNTEDPEKSPAVDEAQSLDRRQRNGSCFTVNSKISKNSPFISEPLDC